MQETFNVLCYTDRGKADSIIVVSLSNEDHVLHVCVGGSVMNI